jgi:hypothetical protein
MVNIIFFKKELFFEIPPWSIENIELYDVLYDLIITKNKRPEIPNYEKIKDDEFFKFIIDLLVKKNFNF